jgi:hypothetical protein
MAVSPLFHTEPRRQFSAGESVYVIDPNGYDIWEARITRIRRTRVFASVADDSERYQWIDLDRIIPKNDSNRAIFDIQERIRSEKMYRELDEVLSDSEEWQQSEVEEIVRTAASASDACDLPGSEDDSELAFG